MRFLLILAIGITAAAQTPQDPQVAATLAKAAAQADGLRHALPSFTCAVRGHSQTLRKDKVEEESRFEGTIRSVRGPGGQMDETTTFTSVNGKPYKEGKHRPYFVHGGFTEVLSYITPPISACSVFTRNGDRIDFATPDPYPTGCAKFRGLHGFFTTDADGNVTHVERTLPDSDDMGVVVPFAAIDLTPVTLKGQTFRLASHIRSDRVYEDVTLRFEADYTDCKLFTTEIRILPGKPVDDPAPQP